MSQIRFKFAPGKALTAIHWMVTETPKLDLHTMLKACYFGDKKHLNKHERPIFGATYQAMRFGPVPLEIYEMAKGEIMWLAELGLKRLPWRRDGYNLVLRTNAEFDRGALSKSDWKAIKAGFEESTAMTFNERTAATHGKDWQRANLGEMKYEDMIEESSRKPELIERLKETGRFMRL